MSPMPDPIPVTLPVDRCPICDLTSGRGSGECDAASATEAYNATVRGTDGWGSGESTTVTYKAMHESQRACRLRKIDWRTRALAAESRAERAEALLKEAHQEIVSTAIEHGDYGADDILRRIDAHLSPESKP